MLTISIASDHSGYLLKEIIIKRFTSKILNFRDLGPSNNAPVDYPDYAAKVTNDILERNSSLGILICKTGIGMSIAANRREGIRAALCTCMMMAEGARAHNDANILVLPSIIIAENLLFDIIDKFLNTSFEGGRHSARLAKLH
ncbi:MAG: ribose 5-phosphate isomerase B [Rickettsiaceae bacterium]|nr:MAG: ribose 5-phosphate isomerase B [Rickettsiaceae bacterium]